MSSIYFDDEREVILDSAAKLFNARGASQTSLNDIAQSAGFTALSVTYYYDSTQDLAAACMHRTIEELDAIITTAGREPSLETRLRRCTILYFELLETVAIGMRPTLINFWDMRALRGPAIETAAQAFVELFRKLREWFAGPKEPPLPRPAQNARTLLVLSAFLSAADWITNFEREEFARCAECFVSVLIQGVAGPGANWRPEEPHYPALSFPLSSDDTYLRLATELINKQGYRGASADEIRRQFCLITSSIRPYDEIDSAEIVDQCFERSFDMIRGVHRAVPRQSGSGWSRLCAIASDVVRHQHSQHGPLLRYYALSIVPYQLRPRWTAKIDRLASLLSGVLSDGIIDRSIRPLDTLITGHMVLAFLNAAAELKYWVRGITEGEAVNLFARPCLLGVSCPTA